jgi:hypothetical protein
MPIAPSSAKAGEPPKTAKARAKKTASRALRQGDLVCGCIGNFCLIFTRSEIWDLIFPEYRKITAACHLNKSGDSLGRNVDAAAIAISGLNLTSPPGWFNSDCDFPVD